MSLFSRFTIFRNLYFALAALLGILTVGVVGYRLIEDYTLLESFYMTVITLSTVGFKEVRPLSEAGQVFTALLIISSFGIFAYAVSTVTRSILSGELGSYFKVYKLEKKIDKLEQHVVVCGFGRNGRRAARKLEAYGQEFVVIENDEQIINRYLVNSKTMYLVGDATQEDILIKAGIGKAKSLLSTLSKDADNLYVVITARDLNRNMSIISRAANESADKKLKAVGANHVIMPEGVGGGHMATLVMSPNIVEFLEYLSIDGSSAINLEEVEVSQLTDRLDSMQIKDLALRQQTGCNIIGLKTPEGEYVINPGAEAKITPNSRLFVLGKPEEIKHLYKILNS
ncbi:potassium channel family protein [Owenweeksia hongkongensis]|uniref:potassium channel family protein n=1 Tax=Owenweeksia hongkongensis TaxID=253245 RepID=UPI003A938DE8